MSPHVEKDDDVLIGASTFAMHVPWWAGSVAADLTNFLERAIRFIEAMLAASGALGNGKSCSACVGQHREPALTARGAEACTFTSGEPTCRTSLRGTAADTI